MQPPRPRLMAISDRQTRGELSPADWLAILRTAGVDTVQIREKHLDDLALLEFARAVRREWSGCLVINARADLAAAAGGDGVHLPSDGVPIAAVRERFGPDFGIGRSTHHPDEVAAAAEAGADWVSFGPIFPTPSKEGMGPPPGLDGLREALRRVRTSHLCILALGGLFEEEVESVLRLVATEKIGVGVGVGAAGIRAFHDPERLPLLVRAFSSPSLSLSPTTTETSDQ